jgi:hypothetical protein
MSFAEHRDMAPPISQRVLELRNAPSPARLYRLVATILAQRRTVEVAHGLACWTIHRPAPVVMTEFGEDLSSRLLRAAAQLAGATPAAWKGRFPHIRRWLPQIVIRSHGACRVGDFTVVGEYGERAARLFLLSGDALRSRDDYVHCAGVRHIHCVHPLDDRRFLVTTGDSSRFLDRWVIERGRLRFDKRLMRFLGGFTAAARVGGEIYLGTDYSGRPNYLMRLSDHRRFYLPADGYLQWIVRMEVVADRYVLVLSKELDLLGSARAISIFDAGSDCFVSSRDFAKRVARLLGGRGDDREGEGTGPSAQP